MKVQRWFFQCQEATAVEAPCFDLRMWRVFALVLRGGSGCKMLYKQLQRNLNATLTLFLGPCIAASQPADIDARFYLYRSVGRVGTGIPGPCCLTSRSPAGPTAPEGDNKPYPTAGFSSSPKRECGEEEGGHTRPPAGLSGRGEAVRRVSGHRGAAAPGGVWGGVIPGRSRGGGGGRPGPAARVPGAGPA